MKTTLITLAMVVGMGLASCGEAAKAIEETVKDCQLTSYEVIYVDGDFDEALNDLVLDYESQDGVLVSSEKLHDDTALIQIFDEECLVEEVEVYGVK